MSKLKFFLILASSLLISCSNPNDPDGGDGTGGGGTGGGGGNFPSWFLTAEQQAKPFAYEQILFTTSANNKYRIPSIIVADNGNIIAFTDNRYGHGGDVGSAVNLDPYYRVSKDGGKTWSAPNLILPKSTGGNNTQGGSGSKGDTILFKSKNANTIVAMAAGGGAWANGGDSGTPGRLLRSESKDNGETWSQWEEINMDSTLDQSQGFTKKFFFSAGRGFTDENGRFWASMLVQKSGAKYIYTAYSDDDGKTWTMAGPVSSSQSVPTGVNASYDEPKIIAKTSDGRLIMSIRNASYNKRLAAKSTDGGMNWFPEGESKDPSKNGGVGAWMGMQDCNVNAEGKVWTTIASGHDKNRIVHIIANGTTWNKREGLALYVSEDEAKSFALKLQIRPTTDLCGYSSMDILPDGTVVVLAEEDKNDNLNGTYNIVFRRYNMKAITGETYNTAWYDTKYEIK